MALAAGALLTLADQAVAVVVLHQRADPLQLVGQLGALCRMYAVGVVVSVEDLEYALLGGLQLRTLGSRQRRQRRITLHQLLAQLLLLGPDLRHGGIGGKRLSGAEHQCHREHPLYDLPHPHPFPLPVLAERYHQPGGRAHRVPPGTRPTSQTSPAGSNSAVSIRCARQPKPHTASGLSSSGSSPKARSMSISLIAEVTNAPSPSSVADRYRVCDRCPASSTSAR